MAQPDPGRGLPVALPMALGVWMAGAVIVSLFAFLLGAPARAAAIAAVLALAPALATLLLAPRWRENWARAIAIDSWAAAAAAAVALTGGPASPVAALFLVGPALALRLSGPGRAGEAAGAAVVAYAVACLAAAAVPALADAPAPGAFTVLAFAFAGWLIAASPPAPVALRAPPVAPPPAQPAAEQDLTQRFAEAAHELRTPLGHIIGFAEIMQRQMFGPLPPKYAEYVDLILSSGRRMQGLATDWLAAGRLAAGRFEIRREEIDLARLVREAGDAARLAAGEKQQTLTVTGADHAAPFSADPRALRQVVDNLLVNAVKFTPAGGRIALRLIAGPNAAIIDVEDNGPGIAPADRARLGVAFERGVNAGVAEGAGLGLMIAGALAQAHGGRIDMLDAETGGALMRVILPSL